MTSYLKQITWPWATGLGVAAAVLVLLSFCAPPAHASTLTEALDASVKLYDGNRPGCSAVVIAPDKILTAAHCVDGSTNLNIRFQTKDSTYQVTKETIIYLKAVRTLKMKDMALLQPKDSKDVIPTQVADIATLEEANSLVAGDNVYAIGYPLSENLTVTQGLFTGKVQSPAENVWDSPVYRHTAPITYGNSGGGFFMKVGDEFKLIGLNVGRIQENHFMNVATPIESVEAILQGFETIRKNTGITTVRRSNVPVGQNGIRLVGD